MYTLIVALAVVLHFLFDRRSLALAVTAPHHTTPDTSLTNHA